jgi:hypothetical protein
MPTQMPRNGRPDARGGTATSSRPAGAQRLHAPPERAHAGQHHRVGRGDLEAGIGGEAGVGADPLERLLGRAQVADAVVEHGDQRARDARRRSHSTPLVDGTPGALDPHRVAQRPGHALERRLDEVVGVAPRTIVTCSVMAAEVTKARQNSSAAAGRTAGRRGSSRRGSRPRSAGTAGPTGRGRRRRAPRRAAPAPTRSGAPRPCRPAPRRRPRRAGCRCPRRCGGRRSRGRPGPTAGRSRRGGRAGRACGRRTAAGGLDRRCPVPSRSSSMARCRSPWWSAGGRCGPGDGAVGWTASCEDLPEGGEEGVVLVGVPMVTRRQPSRRGHEEQLRTSTERSTSPRHTSSPSRAVGAEQHEVGPEGHCRPAARRARRQPAPLLDEPGHPGLHLGARWSSASTRRAA